MSRINVRLVRILACKFHNLKSTVCTWLAIGRYRNVIVRLRSHGFQFWLLLIVVALSRHESFGFNGLVLVR